MRRLKLQFNDVVNDIYSDVIITIYKKLESFRNTDSELKLMAWMQVICSRSATAYMNRKMKNLLYDDSFEEITNLQLRESQNEQWELYEYFISKLRNALKSKKSAEVYIHLFMLKIWNGLSNSQIAAHPCFNSFSDNRINVIINRVREKILKEM
jgi:DNA-directed RNA polymerase specialized sigma24 family protein